LTKCFSAIFTNAAVKIPNWLGRQDINQNDTLQNDAQQTDASRGIFLFCRLSSYTFLADCHSAECHSAECRGAIFCASTPVETKKQKLDEMTTNLEVKTSIFTETDAEMCFNPSLMFRHGQTLADRTSLGPSFQL